MLPLHPNRIDGYTLLHEGMLALTEIEETGIPIDVEYVEREMARSDKRIAIAKKKLLKDKSVQWWKNKYGHKFNLESGPQLADVLFNKLKHKPKLLTKTGNPSTSQKALEQIHHPIVELTVELKRLKKVKNTYLKNILSEQVDGILHPFFNLHTVRTIRSSSSNINFQNNPVRNKKSKATVRKAFIPLKDYLFTEIDFSGIEVGTSCCYHKDKNLIADVVDPKRDMHRDMAMECYKLGKEEWTKETRFYGKNGFVFPQFYGDYYVNCARAMWDAIALADLKTKQGVPLKEHLKKKGINKYGLFEQHLALVEARFWNERYPTYKKWKDDVWEQYQKDGYVDIKTGFRCGGVMEKNKITNYPVQGAAFHCLLWTLIQLHKWLKKKGLKTKIIGQIHDSIVLMIHKTEVNKVLRMAKKIMTKDILRHWDWIIVPLETEVEMAPLNKSWYYKNEVVKGPKCHCGNYWQYLNDNGLYSCPVCGEFS